MSNSGVSLSMIRPSKSKMTAAKATVYCRGPEKR
jgi:hypothetical protein